LAKSRNSYVPAVDGAVKEQLPDALAVPGVRVQLLAYFQSRYVCGDPPDGARASQSVDVGFETPLKLTVTELPGAGVVGLTLMLTPDGGGEEPPPEPPVTVN